MFKSYITAMENEPVNISTEIVPFYDSTLSEESAGEKSPPPAKSRRIEHTWVADNMVFQTLKDAMEAIGIENIWSKIRTHTVEEGRKIYFRCKKVKLRGRPCTSAMYLLLESNSTQVRVFRTLEQHDHDDHKARAAEPGIKPDIKSEISRLFNQHTKPKAMLRILGEAGLEVPSKSQLCNYLSLLKKNKYGPTTISLGELVIWLEAHRKVPENPHQSFVLDYNTDDVDDQATFKFVISTKHLISQLDLAKNVHADSTYKLVWQGFPVLIIGTTDRDLHFHVVALAVTTTEQTSDFQFFFQAILDASVLYCSKAFEPEVLICDAAGAIHVGFKCVFGEKPAIRMCWAHVKMNVRKNVSRFCHDKTIQASILTDVDCLQLASSPLVFEKASNAFLQKWQIHKEFCDYFKDIWLSRNQNWYEGAAENSPSTNNALEAFNRVIKDCGTFRQRFVLAQFLNISSQLVCDWSNEYRDGQKIFMCSVTLTLKHWTTGYQWVKENKTKIITLTRQENCYKFYKVPAKDFEISNEIFIEWSTFDQYRMNHFSSYEVGIPQDTKRWAESGSCTCPSFFKHNMCKHLIGVAIRLGLATVPPTARNLPIGQKRKRGRPQQAKKALIIQ